MRWSGSRLLDDIINDGYLPRHWLKYFSIPDVNHVSTSLKMTTIIKILMINPSWLSYTQWIIDGINHGVPSD